MIVENLFEPSSLSKYYRPLHGVTVHEHEYKDLSEYGKKCYDNTLERIKNNTFDFLFNVNLSMKVDIKTKYLPYLKYKNGGSWIPDKNSKWYNESDLICLHTPMKNVVVCSPEPNNTTYQSDFVVFYKNAIGSELGWAITPDEKLYGFLSSPTS